MDSLRYSGSCSKDTVLVRSCCNADLRVPSYGTRFLYHTGLISQPTTCYGSVNKKNKNCQVKINTTTCKARLIMIPCDRSCCLNSRATYIGLDLTTMGIICFGFHVRTRAAYVLIAGRTVSSRLLFIHHHTPSSF